MIKYIFGLFLFVASSYQAVDHSKSFLINEIGAAVFSLAFDQKYLYIPTSNDIVQRDFETNNIVRTLRGHDNYVGAVFLLNDTLVSGSSDGLILQWNLTTGGIIKRLDAACYFFSMVWYQNSILVECQMIPSRMIDFHSGKVLHTFDVNLNFYVYGDLIYGYHSKTAFYGFNSDLTKSIVYNGEVSAAFRSGDFMYVGDFLSLYIVEISLLTLETVIFTGPSHADTIISIHVVGKNLISAGLDSKLLLWNITTKSLSQVLSCNRQYIYTILDFNASALLLTDSISAIELCDFEQNAVLRSFVGKHNNLYSLAVYKDSLFSGSPNVELKEWSLSTKEQLPSFPNKTFTSGNIFIVSDFLLTCVHSISVIDLNSKLVTKNFAAQDVFCIFFYYMNGMIFAPSLTFGINQYNLSSELLMREYRSVSITSQAFNVIAVDTYLFGCYQQDFVAEFDINTGNLLHISDAVPFYSPFSLFAKNIFLTNGPSIFTIEPDTFSFTLIKDLQYSSSCIFYDPISKIVFVAYINIDGLDTTNGYANVYHFEGHSNNVRSFVVNNGYLFSSSDDGTVKQWSLTTKRIVYSYEDRSKSITALVAFNDTLLFGNQGGEFFEFQISSAFIGITVFNHKKTISDFAVGNGFVFVCSLDQTISILNSSGLSLKHHVETNAIPQALFLSSEFLYVGFNDFSISQLDPQTARVIKTFLGHNAVINDILTEGTIMFSAGSDYIVCRWNLESAEVDMRLKGHLDQVTSLAWNEKNLFSASLDKTIIIWDTITGNILNLFKRTISVPGHVGPVNSIIYCNGNLFSASSDLTIKQWDSSGAVLDTLFGHKKSVTCLSCVDNFLFSGSEDFAVFMWYPNYHVNNILSSTIVGASSRYLLPLGGTGQTTTSPFLIPILGGVAALVLFLLCFIGFNFYYGRKIFTLSTSKLFVGSPLLNSSDYSSTTDNATLFTEHLGISIPGYLEIQGSSFRFQKQIAKGGGGAVYLVEVFNKTETFVAKLVTQNYEDLQPLMKSGFDQEITLMEYLKGHRNMAKIVAFCRSPCCIIMKYYERGSLRGLIYSKGVLTLNHLIKFVLDVCEGLRYMHSKQLAHNDLKPDNVLVDSDEKGIFMVLTDFGITQILSDQHLAAREFQITNLKGLSVSYAAPEVFKRFRNRNLYKTYSSSDVYSLAIVLCEMLTRRQPTF